MLALSALYVAFGAVPLVAALFFGLQCAGAGAGGGGAAAGGEAGAARRRSLGGGGAAFAALFLFRLPFPLVVAAAALLGALLPGRFVPPSHGRRRTGRRRCWTRCSRGSRTASRGSAARRGGRGSRRWRSGSCRSRCSCRRAASSPTSPGSSPRWTLLAKCDGPGQASVDGASP
jgi:chromate transporter